MARPATRVRRPALSATEVSTRRAAIHVATATVGNIQTTARVLVRNAGKENFRRPEPPLASCANQGITMLETGQRAKSVPWDGNQARTKCGATDAHKGDSNP